MILLVSRVRRKVMTTCDYPYTQCAICGKEVKGFNTVPLCNTTYASNEERFCKGHHHYIIPVVNRAQRRGSKNGFNQRDKFFR